MNTQVTLLVLAADLARVPTVGSVYECHLSLRRYRLVVRRGCTPASGPRRLAQSDVEEREQAPIAGLSPG